MYALAFGYFIVTNGILGLDQASALRSEDGARLESAPPTVSIRPRQSNGSKTDSRESCVETGARMMQAE